MESLPVPPVSVTSGSPTPFKIYFASSATPSILGLDKVAASTRVIEPLSTLKIRSLPFLLFCVEYEPPEMISLEVSLKPVMVSLPSPAR